MSVKILYLGNAGSGKSTSYCKVESLGIEGLDPKSTGIINVVGKALSMRRWKDHYNKKNKNYIESKDIQSVLKYLDKYKELTHIKNIIIDDFQYLFSLDFIDKIKDKKNGFAKYEDALLHITQLLTKAGEMRDDQIVWILSHLEEYEDEHNVIHKRFKAVGKATHRQLSPEGLFENVFYGETIKEDGEDRFKKVIRVHGTDVDTCRSAPDLFPVDTTYISNDLAIIEKEIRDYYGI